MSPTAREILDQTARFARTPTARKVAWWIVGLIVFVAIVGFLIAPPLVKHKLEEELTTQLHRKTTIERVRINPFALSITVQGFVVRERSSDEQALSFEELYAAASSASLFRLAPVVNQVRLVKPHVRVVRNEDKTYNYQDLIDEFLAKPAGPTPRFSLNNIEVIDGRIDFDDRPAKQQHRMTNVKIGIPFLSSLPYATDINVQPALSARFDGAPLGVTGQTKPFENTRPTTLNVDIDALQFARYLDYSPVPLNFSLVSGQIDTRLRLSFAMPGNQPNAATLAGAIHLSNIDLRDPGGTPLLLLPSLAAEIESFDVLGKSAKVKSVRIDGVVAHLKRLKNGALNVMALISAAPKRPAASKASMDKTDLAKPAAAAPARALTFTIDDIRIANGTVHVEDEVPAKPARIVLDDFTLGVQGLSNARDASATARLSFKAEALNAFAWTGNFQLEPMRADGKLDVTGLRLGVLRPYYDGLLNLEIPQGTLDLTTSFVARLDGAKFDAQVSDLGATVNSLQARLPADKGMLARVPALEIGNASADLGKHSLAIGEIKGRDASARIVRDGDGRINLMRIMKPGADVGANADSAPWNISVKRIALDRFAIDYQDLTQKSPVKSRVSQLSVNAENLSNAKGAKGRVSIRATVNKAGKLALSGPVGINPIALNMRVETKAVDLLPLQPLVEDQLNVAITSGALSAKGAVTLELPPHAPVKASYKGELGVTDFASIDKLTLEDLLQWKSLYIGGIDATLQPLQAGVDEIALTDFYSRLIVNSDATLNLQHIVKKSGEPETSGTSPPVPPAAKPAAAGRAQGANTPPPPARVQQEGPAGLPPNLSIGKITLQNGAINFTDHFIKPNYSADLSEITGSVSKMTQDTPGDVVLHGHVQKTAPLEITGRVNPLSRDLFVDLTAGAKDVELPPLTPYAVKYAGYGIEKGKLSMDVKYHLENRKLDAENRIYLDQLTFGDKVDSPTATKLPVLLAVALLKDRNGVIDINLPISGTLDDPQFSLGGIIVRVIVNLLVKAVTSPFALLGSIFGGGEELAYLEFAPGSAAITPASAKKLETVAKALSDRPGLKMEIAGRVDADSDKGGLRHASLERKVKSQKLKTMLKSGNRSRRLITSRSSRENTRNI